MHAIATLYDYTNKDVGMGLRMSFCFGVDILLSPAFS